VTALLRSFASKLKHMSETKDSIEIQYLNLAY